MRRLLAACCLGVAQRQFPCSNTPAASFRTSFIPSGRSPMSRTKLLNCFQLSQTRASPRIASRQIERHTRTVECLDILRADISRFRHPHDMLRPLSRSAILSRARTPHSHSQRTYRGRPTSLAEIDSTRHRPNRVPLSGAICAVCPTEICIARSPGRRVAFCRTSRTRFSPCHQLNADKQCSSEKLSTGFRSAFQKR
jgi:hypothetical protein